MDQDEEEDVGDRLAQKEEIEILTEILDAGCFSANKDTTIYSGHLDTKVRIEGKILHVKCPKYEAENDDDRLWELEHLPPLTLHFSLPLDYPSNSKPDFTLTSKWLSSEALSVLCKKLDELWEVNKGMPILFKWHSYLKHEVLSTFGFTSIDVYHLISTFIQSPEIERIEKSSQLDPRAIAEECTEMTLLEYLVGYDQYQRQKEFLRSFHSCPICLTEKRGSDCITLSWCLHTFCVECLKDYFSLHITEGSLDSVKCPDLDCGVVPCQKELEKLVGPELFQRYDTILLNRGLDHMTDISTCPRITCRQPVLVSDDPKDKLGECGSCGYAFCKYCKLLYHGVERCLSAQAEAKLLCKKYVSGSKKDREYLEIKYGKEKFMTGEVFEEMYRKYVSGTEREREIMEKACGKKMFEEKLAFQRREERRFTQNWIKSNTKACPRCDTQIEKNGGCNHMTCWKCTANFDWGNPRAGFYF